ncbi:MAG: Piwi domain protein [Roseivirga sp.]|nr:Piwi domain protein [Roseivirga sp.]
MQIQNMQSNFYPIEISFEDFQIQRTPYEAEKLKSLRRDHNGTHSFFRSDDYIYISRNGEKEIEEGELVTLNVEENPRIIRSLIKHIFFRTFRDKYLNILPLDFYPFRFLSRQDSHDLIKGSLPAGMKEKIGFTKQTEVQFRDIQEGDKTVFGAVINESYRWIFNINCEQLYRESFNLQELDIIHAQHLHGMEGVLAADESLVGRFISTNGKTAKIDTNEGEVEFPLNELYINKTKGNIEKYISFKLGESKANRVFAGLRSNDIERYNAVKLKKQLDATAKLLSTLNFHNADGFNFTISDQSLVPQTSFSLKKATYIFDYAGLKTNYGSDYGLNQYGPWDDTTFEIKRPKVLVICHRSNRGGYSSFLGKLKSGLPNSNWFKKGIVDKYKLHDIDFVWHEIDDYDLSTYKSAVEKAVRDHSDNLFDLAIVETKQEFKSRTPDQNPYYHLKANLMALAVPVQFIKSDNTRLSDNGLEALLNAVCLQMYAKLGGTPWVIPANQNIDRELIIGIGSSVTRQNKYTQAEQAKVVGITTFFSADGRYLLGDRSRDVPYAQYFEELLNSLKTSIELLSSQDGWQNGDTVRIVFHVFKPLKNIEIEVVNKLVSEFENYQIKFAFVTISDVHPLMLFDEKQKGITWSNKTKGALVPDRGTNVVLNSYSCLLQLKGPKEIKTIRQGISRPVLIRIHPDSTFHDLNYITQQIFTFTSLSWRTFFPSQMPVSLYYANLIARLLSRLRQIEGWNPNVISTSKLKFKKWFL